MIYQTKHDRLRDSVSTIKMRLRTPFDCKPDFFACIKIPVFISILPFLVRLTGDTMVRNQ